MDVNPKSRSPQHSHLAIEFATTPSPADLDRLRELGAIVLGPLSATTFVISAPVGFSAESLSAASLATFTPQSKMSPRLNPSIRLAERAAGDAYYIAEFFLDVDMGDARAIATEAGLLVIDNPDLLPNHLLVQGSMMNLNELTAWDEVEYVFPASSDLVQGNPVNSCAGALTSAGPVSQGVPIVGDGWDGPGRNAAALNYAFVSVTDKLPADTAQSEIVRAFNEWAKYAKLTFTATDDPSALRTLAVTFARGAHGDQYPFSTGMLAHTFYPFPLNPEPLAGDLHFNVDENWHTGADTDLFSVALHETGHALGLGHSDNPDDVMYPYYKRVTTLAQGDIAAVLELYAAQDGGNTPPAPALAMTVQTPPSSVTTPSITLSGTLTGGAGNVQVTWSNGTSSGAAQGSPTWTASIPLAMGANTVTMTAADSQGATASAVVTVTREAAPATPSVTIIDIAQPASSGTYNTGASAVTISGMAADSSGIDHISWTSSRGGSGLATGTTSWTAGPISLSPGQNSITATAYGAGGGSASRTITVNYTPPPPPSPPPPPPSNPPSTQPANNTAPPSLTIIFPSTTNAFTSAATIVFSGTASGGAGIASVTWTNSNGGSGTANGTTSWTTPPIPLLVGSNMITIRATDGAGKFAWRSVMVTRGQ